MKTINPYAAPQGEYLRDPAPAESWANRNVLWLLFSFQGRIPRIAFWSAGFVIACVHYGTIYFVTKNHWIEKSPWSAIAVIVEAVLAIWCSFAIQGKRWHDLGKSAWWNLMTFVPLIGPIWTLVETGFFRGTNGQNAYGPDSI